ncbi:VTT domain-containing protein [Streptomyces hirsutus]|uniref:VTT domain-containing protein n=1 Tax=Streptomyces hirsutus TaxID=35620 RepID=A0ABZ1GRV9_9ACTN|nr:VTT domain-containing protein [Streptomyces hirsutus]WSD08057.1 VTT domain-containing protein [Streptomyces hirsutus]
MTTLALGPEWLSPDYLIETFSLTGILLIVFAESGFFAFLPGDSLLFTAGLFVAEGSYISQPLWLVCTLIVIAAVLGDQVGYMIGKFFGPRLFSRPNSKLFKQENLEKAHEFMEKYGPKAIVLARFVPIVRTFAPITAGAGRMKYRTFLTYNLIGGVAWGSGVTLAGYWLGQIGFIKDNVETILILIVFLSVVPIIVEFLRERAKKKRGDGDAVADAPQQGEYEAYAARQATPYAQPVMDDATTQLRRITPDGPPPPQHRQQAPQPQQPYGNQGHPQQPQQPQQPYGNGQDGGYDQYYGGQYPQGQYPQGQGGQEQGGRGQAPDPRRQQPYDQGY